MSECPTAEEIAELGENHRRALGDTKFLLALIRRQARSFSFFPLWPSRVGEVGHDARVVATFGAAPGFREASAWVPPVCFDALSLPAPLPA